MRRLIIAFTFIIVLIVANFSIAATSFPALTGRIVDNAHILNSENVQALTTELADHEQRTGEQIVVVTVPSLNGIPIEDFGYQLGRAWGIGQKGKNNGALLIIAPQEHQTRIEVGYGMEDRLTDATCATIISRIIVPAFRSGDYNGGIAKGTAAILSALGDPNGDDQSTVTPISPPQSHSPLPYLPLILFFLLFLLIRRSNRRQSIIGPLVIGSMLGRSGGFGGDNGFGGGFIGGGGSFGGGGASGSW